MVLTNVLSAPGPHGQVLVHLETYIYTYSNPTWTRAPYFVLIRSWHARQRRLLLREMARNELDAALEDLLKHIVSSSNPKKRAKKNRKGRVSAPEAYCLRSHIAELLIQSQVTTKRSHRIAASCSGARVQSGRERLQGKIMPSYIDIW